MHFSCPSCDKEGKTLDELRASGCNCNAKALKMLDGPEEAEKIIETKKRKQKEDDERSTSKKVYDFAMSKIIKLVIAENDSDCVYAIIENNGHMESLNLESKRARQWIYDQYSRNVESNEIHGDDFYKKITETISAKAQMNGTERTKIYIRIAQTENQILYDLGTPNWDMIKITPDKIETVGFDASLPVFQRRQSLQVQVIPREGNGKELEDLAVLLDISNEDRLIFIVHLVCMFLESCAVPMMVFDGSAGSLKTTTTSAIKRIVDPSGIGIEDNVSAMAENSDDLIIQLNNRYMSGFDNVSFIDVNTSNVLCRTITGSSNMRRRKYSNDDEVIHSFKRKVVLNGVVPTLDYADLQTRILSYVRRPLDENNRITDEEFNEKFEQLLPGILARIFITLSNALKAHPELKNKIKPKNRMADFQIWGEIIARVLGYEENEFLNSCHSKLIQGQISLIDSHPVIGLIQSFMEGREQYENTITHLYQQISDMAEKSGIDINSRYAKFPKTSSYFKKELKVVDPSIRAIGFTIETHHYTKNDGRFTKNASIVMISKKITQSTLNVSQIASPPSLPSPTENLGTKPGEASGEATNNMHSPKNAESANKSYTGEAGEASEAISDTSLEQQFYCKTCKAGPWKVNTVGSAGMKIIDFHKNHEIVFQTGTK